MIHKIQIKSPPDVVSKALFVDRDGVINKRMSDHDYVKSWSEFIFNPKSLSILKKGNNNGYRIIVITNQRGIGRGIISPKTFVAISRKMVKELRNKDIVIDAIYYCPHLIKDNCSCRKPKPGLIVQAAKDYNLDLKKSLMIGDSEEDILAAKKAGVGKFVKVRSDLKYFRNNVVNKLIIS